jgi:hypothetical protein
LIPGDEHNRFQDDLAAYLLDALEPAERGVFEAHLETCGRCQAEERWLRVAVDVLPASVEQVDPPSELRDRLLEIARREAPPAPKGRALARRRRFRLMLRPAVAVGIAGVMAAAVGVYLVGNSDQAPASSTVAFRATPIEPGAKAKIVRSADTAVVRVEKLPVQRPGHVYELWLRRGGNDQLEPSSLFVVGRDGRGSAGIPGGLEGVREVLATLEPQGGSARPTAQPVLRATL